ncbi:LysR family transcriptional regulator [Legionella dresdenensis]|uniref:LysR family transcriptional regulator n=1 Tax=Legionella dresdenensis TaxID=450200 RepID=A0ABV8CEE5_9GAMM
MLNYNELKVDNGRGMYNLGQIACFLKVAELNSFSNAAESLFLTTTAVSKQIKNLEQAIGEQLFQRTTRQVKLTEFGVLFYERCKTIAEQINSIDLFIESQKKNPQGQLNVLVSTITCRDMVLQFLPEFMTLYPLIELNIDFSEQDDQLARGDLDIMVGFPLIPPATDSLRYRKIFTVSNILCASPAFVERYGMPVDAGDLPRYPVISHSLRKPAHYLPLADGGQLPTANPILYMNSFAELNQACLAGIGMFLTGDSLVEHWLDSGELIRLLPQYAFRCYDIYIFYRAYDFELPKVKVFMDFFTARLGQRR